MNEIVWIKYAVIGGLGLLAILQKRRLAGIPKLHYSIEALFGEKSASETDSLQLSTKCILRNSVLPSEKRLTYCIGPPWCEIRLRQVSFVVVK